LLNVNLGSPKAIATEWFDYPRHAVDAWNALQKREETR
jgi:hypothetical protein